MNDATDQLRSLWEQADKADGADAVRAWRHVIDVLTPLAGASPAQHRQPLGSAWLRYGAALWESTLAQAGVDADHVPAEIVRRVTDPDAGRPAIDALQNALRWYTPVDPNSAEAKVRVAQAMITLATVCDLQLMAEDTKELAKNAEKILQHVVTDHERMSRRTPHLYLEEYAYAVHLLAGAQNLLGKRFRSIGAYETAADIYRKAAQVNPAARAGHRVAAQHAVLVNCESNDPKRARKLRDRHGLPADWWDDPTLMPLPDDPPEFLWRYHYYYR
jgi:hypothetical protein